MKSVVFHLKIRARARDPKPLTSLTLPTGLWGEGPKNRRSTPWRNDHCLTLLTSRDAARRPERVLPVGARQSEAENAVGYMVALALVLRAGVGTAITRTEIGLGRRSRSVGGCGTSCGHSESWRQYDDLENGQSDCAQYKRPTGAGSRQASADKCQLRKGSSARWTRESMVGKTEEGARNFLKRVRRCIPLAASGGGPLAGRRHLRNRDE